MRQTIDRTGKLKMIGGLSLVLWVSLLICCIIHWSSWRGIAGLLVSLIVGWYMCVMLSVILLWPLDMTIRQRILWRARRQLRSHPDLTIIAITGSYGKTSAKHIITHLLGDSETTLMTSGNLNTPLGIARVIGTQLTSRHRFFVVEMGAYKPGNIRNLCRFVDPSIGIITGITAQHLERFGSLDAIIQTKYELIDHLAQRRTCSHGIICLTSDDAQRAYDTKKTTYTDTDLSLQTITPSQIDVEMRDDFGGITVSYDDKHITTPLLAPHNSSYIVAGLMIGEIVGASQEGMIAQMRVSGRRWLLTPGLVELGDESEQIHSALGAEILQSYDGFLFVETKGTRAMAASILSLSPDTQIIRYNTTQEAHAALGQVLEAGDVIVFQNDITDNYG